MLACLEYLLIRSCICCSGGVFVAVVEPDTVITTIWNSKYCPYHFAFSTSRCNYRQWQAVRSLKPAPVGRSTALGSAVEAPFICPR